MILNSIHNAGVARWRAARPTNGLRSNGNGIMENRITNSQEIIGEQGKKLHNNNNTKKISSILLMEIQGRKRGRYLLVPIHHRSERLPVWKKNTRREMVLS